MAIVATTTTNRHHHCGRSMAGNNWPWPTQQPIVVATASGCLGDNHCHPLSSRPFFAQLDLYLKF